MKDCDVLYQETLRCEWRIIVQDNNLFYFALWIVFAIKTQMDNAQLEYKRFLMYEDNNI